MSHIFSILFPSGADKCKDALFILHWVRYYLIVPKNMNHFYYNIRNDYSKICSQESLDWSVINLWLCLLGWLTYAIINNFFQYLITHITSTSILIYIKWILINNIKFYALSNFNLLVFSILQKLSPLLACHNFWPSVFSLIFPILYSLSCSFLCLILFALAQFSAFNFYPLFVWTGWYPNQNRFLPLFCTVRA